MKKLLSMALVLMMICSLLAVPAMAADSISITETNDYGTVTAEVGGTTITVVADKGYYLYSAILNGADILASMTAGYDDVRDAAVCPKETWTYTLTEGTLTASDELVVAYGYYSTEDMVAGGDADTALGTVGAWNTNGTCEIVNLDGNNVFWNKDSRLRSTSTWKWTPGEKYMIQYDAKLVDPEDVNTEARFYADSTVVCPNGRKYTLPYATSDWTTYTTYMDVVSDDTDYVFFQSVIQGTDDNGDARTTDGVYFDNLHVYRLTKAGIVPESYGITVTEVNDYGSVTAPASVYSTDTADIKIVPETGYYVHSITVDGVDVTSSLVRSWEGDTFVKAAYTYTLDGATLADDAEVAVTYGYYTMEAMTTDIADNATGTRWDMPRWAWTLDEIYLVNWDLKLDSGTGTTTLSCTNGVTQVAPTNSYNPNFAATSDWTSYQTYVVMISSKSSDYFSFRASANATINNVSVNRLTKAGIVPVSYDINVTENADNGSVTADATILDTETKTIKIVPNEGYYLDSVTLNGTDITESFTTVYEKYDTATAWGYAEASTYTIVGSALTEDVNLAVAYGAYTQTPVYAGGDAETAMGAEGQDFSAQSTDADAVITDADNNGGTSSFYFSAGRLAGSRIDWTSGELYLVKWDAKAPTATENSTLRFMAPSTADRVNGSDRQYVDTPVTTSWKSYSTYLVINTDVTNSYADFRNPSVPTYVDNISFVKLTKGAVEPPAPTEFDVIITGENAVVSVADAVVETGMATTFTVAPKFGYYIASITIGGNNFTGFDAYNGGTYGTGEINADTEIVVTTASYAVNDKGVATNVATLPAVFAPTVDSAVTFGKVLDRTDATSWGIELTKDGVGVTPYHGGSYLYKALATNANGQYAIEFIGLEAGTYQIRSYVYVNGTPVFGAPSTFVVD